MTVGDFIRNMAFCDIKVVVFGIRPYYEALELDEDREVVIADDLDTLVGLEEQDKVARYWDKINVTHFEIESWDSYNGNRGIVRLYTDVVISKEPQTV